MNPTTEQRRIRAYERIYGPYPCASYGTRTTCQEIAERRRAAEKRNRTGARDE